MRPRYLATKGRDLSVAMFGLEGFSNQQPLITRYIWQLLLSFPCPRNYESHAFLPQHANLVVETISLQRALGGLCTCTVYTANIVSCVNATMLKISVFNPSL